MPVIVGVILGVADVDWSTVWRPGQLDIQCLWSGVGLHRGRSSVEMSRILRQVYIYIILKAHITCYLLGDFVVYPTLCTPLYSTYTCVHWLERQKLGNILVYIIQVSLTLPLTCSWTSCPMSHQLVAQWAQSGSWMTGDNIPIRGQNYLGGLERVPQTRDKYLTRNIIWW